MSALISLEMGNFDKVPVFMAEADEMGLKILPPDVNSSGVRFRPVDDGIAYGLAGIKNVGEGAAKAIVEERRANGPFTSAIEFCARVDMQDVNRKVIESLARCGAMDSLEAHRAKAFNGIDFAMSRAATKLRDERSGQGNLFDLLESPDLGSQTDDALPDCDEWHESELLAAERELLGTYMSGHPLTRYAPLLNQYQLSTVTSIGDLEHGTQTRIGGIAGLVVKKVTKKKEMMAVVTLEDLDGSLEVVVFSDAFRKYGDVLAPQAPLLVCGEVSKKEGVVSLRAAEIYPLDDAPKFFAQRVNVRITCVQLPSHLEELRGILRLHPGTVPVHINLAMPSGEKIVMDTDSSYKVLPDLNLIHSIEHTLGENTVHVAVNPNPLRNGNGRRKQWRR